MAAIKNPNFKDEAEFHKSLMARGKGAKDYPNSHTEVEYLGNGKFAASIGVGHRVFFDKADGNKPKKHKLTDERPGKDYILVQGPKCCVEVYPYYAKYFDLNHEEVRLYEERWVVQRLFKTPDTWRDVDAYNPRMAVEEYSEPAGDVVKVIVTYDTDYGVLTVEYFQRDGNALKHNVTFKNTSGGSETFRVLQKWAGIVGTKINSKDFPVDVDEPFLAFRRDDKKLTIAENLHSMIFNPDGSEKTNQCLKRPVGIETHAQGMKCNFCYGNWVLTQNESLEIDPDTATLDDPTEDGDIRRFYSEPGWDYERRNADAQIHFGAGPYSGTYRGYVEWDISSISDEATITDTKFRYDGSPTIFPGHGAIREMVGHRPSTSTDLEVYDEAGEGTVYVSADSFPEKGTGKEVDLGSSAVSDLQSQLANNWFAIGIESPDFWESNIHSEEYAEADPKPTLYVEYTPPPTPVADGDLIGIAIIKRS